MILYVVRHGQATHNLGNIMNGDPKKPVHLTELGRKQAQKAAKELKDVKFDVIFVSEFPRTHETAEIINKFHNLPLKIDPLINDIKTGLEGKNSETYRSEREKAAKKQKTDIFKAKINNGESIEDVKNRVYKFLEKLKSKNFKTVLIVTHYDPLELTNCYVNNLSLEHLRDIRPKNCEIHKFKL